MRKKLKCILLIDDDYPTNCFNQLILEDAGVSEKIQILQSAEEALDYLSNTGKFQSNGKVYPQPELIFLDINMPAMNGWEFLEKYKELPGTQKGNIVVVMLTASPNPEDQQKAGSIEDVSDFLNKPLTPVVVQEIMEEHFK